MESCPQQEKVDGDPYAVLADCLTSIRGVNKTDVLTLSSNFGSLKNIIDSSMEELSLCPGLGARKVKNLHETFRAPLDPTKKKRKQVEAQIESFLNRKVRQRARSSEHAVAVPAATVEETCGEGHPSKGESSATSRQEQQVSRKGKEKVNDSSDGSDHEDALV